MTYVGNNVPFKFISNNQCDDEEKYYRLLNKAVAIHLYKVGQESLRVFQSKPSDYSYTIGNTYHNLTVLSVYKNENNKIRAITRCRCGNERDVDIYSLLRNDERAITDCENCTKKKRLKDYSYLVGQKYKKLTVLSWYRDENNDVFCHCLCDCGEKCDIRAITLLEGKIGSCGCLKRKDYSFMIGQTYNNLTVLDISRKMIKDENVTFARCKCSCGVEKDIPAGQVLNGKIKSCGHLKERDYSFMIRQIYGELTVLGINYEATPISAKVKCSCGVEKYVPVYGLLNGDSKTCGNAAVHRRKYNELVKYSDDGTKVFLKATNKPDNIFIVDYFTWIYFSSFCWFLTDDGYMQMSIRVEPGKYKQYAYHRLLLDCPIEDGYVRDHINRNKLDNTYENLRVISWSGNSYNRGIQKNNTTEVKGVSVFEDYDLYYVDPQWTGLNDNGELYKSFKNDKEAAITYRQKLEEKYQGHFLTPLETKRLINKDGTLNHDFPFYKYEYFPWKIIFEIEERLLKEGTIPMQYNNQE